MEYRGDIDGLRAIAVLAVLFYHLELAWIPGGLVGVDIFFVISGYLIGSIILHEIERGTFSLLRFYDRRIRRLFPALIVMLAVSLLLAWFTILPEQMVDFAKSEIATTFFVSNFYFWQESGYFQTDSKLLPLLHTWTLSIEEQFYLLFPLFMGLVYQWKKSLGKILLFATFVASLGLTLGILLIAIYPNIAFYLLPFRAWELLLGVLLAIYLSTAKPNGQLSSLFSWLGLGMIVLALLLNPLQTHIVLIIILATGGTGLLIVSGSFHVPLINRVLENRLLVFIGLISYSLYLWHWPILVFLRLWFVEFDLSAELKLMAGICSLVMAVLSWQFIEKTFRKPRHA